MNVLSLHTKLDLSRIALHFGKTRKERHYNRGSQPVGHDPSDVLKYIQIEMYTSQRSPQYDHTLVPGLLLPNSRENHCPACTR